MTSSLRLKARRSSDRPSALGRQAFTLIEMLVVIGIILLLLALLLPALSSVHRNALRNSMAADLQVISQALEAYKGDFGDYPRSGTLPTPSSGAVILCWALIAPGPASASTGPGPDGADGPGFRLRATGQGRIYGPYLPVDRFVVGTASSTGVVTPGTGIYDDTTAVIADRSGNIILYFPAARNVAATARLVGSTNFGGAGIGVVPQTSTYNYQDNLAYLSVLPNTLTDRVMSCKLGAASPGNGMLGPGETVATSAPYILWSAGPDGQFGPSVTGSSVAKPDDDVTYPVLNAVPVGFNPYP